MSDLMVRDYGEATYGSGYYGAAAIDPVPFFVVEVQAPLGTWVDVTCDVRAIEIHRGRSKMLDAWAASTLTISFADFSDRYNAWNPAGLWATNGAFRTGVPLRISVERNGARRVLFTGTTDNVADSWPNAGADALTTIDATDAFKGLARQQITGAAAQELSGARVGRILTAAGFMGPRLIDAGLSTMAAVTMSGVAVDLLDEVRESEWGWLYVNSDGAAVFRQRDARATDPRMVNVQYTFTDGDEPIGFAGVVPSILQEPFDNLSAWTTVTGAASIVAGRTASAVQLGPSTCTIGYTIPAAQEADELWIGFAYRTNTLLSTRIVELRSDAGATLHTNLATGLDGALIVNRSSTVQLATSAPGVITTNTWYYVELRYKLADSGASVEVRVNGSPVVTASGLDTRNAGTKAVYDTIRLNASSGATVLYDDLYVNVGAFLGDVQLPVTGAPIFGACYSSLTLMASDDDVINTADVTRTGGIVQHAQDDASRGWFGARTYTRSTVPLALDNDALALAQTVVADHAQNERRVDAITFYASDDLSYEAAYSVRMLDRVRVIRHTNVAIDAELLVQGIRHTITPLGADRRATWAVTLQTTNARLVRDAGLWDVSQWDVDKWSV